MVDKGVYRRCRGYRTNFKKGIFMATKNKKEKTMTEQRVAIAEITRMGFPLAWLKIFLGNHKIKFEAWKSAKGKLVDTVSMPDANKIRKLLSTHKFPLYNVEKHYALADFARDHEVAKVTVDRKLVLLQIKIFPVRRKDNETSIGTRIISVFDKKHKAALKKEIGMLGISNGFRTTEFTK